MSDYANCMLVFFDVDILFRVFFRKPSYHGGHTLNTATRVLLHVYWFQVATNIIASYYFFEVIFLTEHNGEHPILILNYTRVKKQSRLDVRKYSFSQKTINVWNKLSTDCVHASSVNMFKNKIDKYLVKGYI